jgi:hypothetical protein
MEESELEVLLLTPQSCIKLTGTHREMTKQTVSPATYVELLSLHQYRTGTTLTNLLKHFQDNSKV